MPLITAFSCVLLPMLKGRKLYPVFQFYPPIGMTPADLAVAVKKHVLPRDMISMVFYWSAKGYMDMAEIETPTAKGFKKGFSFRRLKTMGLEAKQYEMKMFREMFTYGQDNEVLTSDLEKSTFRFALRDASREAKRHFNSQKGRHFKRSIIRSAIVSFPGAVSLGLAVYPYVASSGLFNSQPYAYLASFGLAAAVALVLGTPIFIGLGRASNPEKITGGLAIALIPLALASGLLFGFAYQTGDFPRLMLGLACCATSLFLAFKCKRRTEGGCRYWEHVLGFKSFLESANKPRLQQLEEENPEYFTTIFPYAMVLGYGEKWTKNYGQLHVERPFWYHSKGDEILLPKELAADITEGISGLSR
jgi:hypothetical protein